MTSLKPRLFCILVAATGLIWFVATSWIYVGKTREVENVLDSRLQEAARMVLSLAASNGVSSFQKGVDLSHVAESLNYEHQLGGDAFAPNASVFEQGCAGLSLGTAHRCHSFTRYPWRTSSPL
jgi:hypothetical protein